MTTSTKRTPALPRGVYKFRYGHQVFYRLGRNVEDARGILAKELKVKSNDIITMESGSKQ